MKIYLLILSSLLLTFSFTVVALPLDCSIAPNESREASQFLTACAAATKGIDPLQFSPDMSGTKDMVIKIANGAISFGALLAVGAIVWSGIQYTKAYGDDEKLKKAKTTGIFALIGLTLLMVSFGIVDIFINFIYTITGN